MTTVAWLFPVSPITPLPYYRWSAREVCQNRGVQRRPYTSMSRQSSSINADDTNEDPLTSSRATDPFTTVQEIEGPFTPIAFAETKCWQRRPLLVRNAFEVDPILDNEDTDEEQEDEAPEFENTFSSSLWPPSLEEVMDLACEEDVESRIITHIPKDDASYNLQIGPFEEQYLHDLLQPSENKETQEKHTKNTANDTSNAVATLLVNDVDRFLPHLSDFIDQEFAFLPHWRMDDGQISLANKGGGIGYHVDNYDVFLIQLSGERRWSVGRRLVGHEEETERLVEGIDVRILRQHRDADLDNEQVAQGVDNGPESIPFILRPGDILYLPPRIPHKGTAVTDLCATLSVGCRAPSASEMWCKLTEEILSSTMAPTSSLPSAWKDAALSRYKDVGLLDHFLDSRDKSSLKEVKSVSPSEAAAGQLVKDVFQRRIRGEITLEARHRAKQLIRDSLKTILDDDDQFDRWFGSYVTESNHRVRPGYPRPIIVEDDDEEEQEWRRSLGVWGDPKSAVQAFLDGKGCLFQAEGIKFGFSVIGGKKRLFVDGSVWETSSSNVPVEVIASNRRMTLDCFIDNVRDCTEATQLLEHLIARGLLYGMDNI